MSRITYADIYDYDRLWEAWRRLHPFQKPDADESWLYDLHNELVWHTYKPRMDADRDEVVCTVIRSLCRRRKIRPGGITDEHVDALVRALFSCPKKGAQNENLY